MINQKPPKFHQRVHHREGQQQRQGSKQTREQTDKGDIQSTQGIGARTASDPSLLFPRKTSPCWFSVCIPEWIM